MDWLTDFSVRFQRYPELRKLKAEKFHGSVTINFCNGVPQNTDYKLHRRSDVTMYTEGEETTQTMGGK